MRYVDVVLLLLEQDILANLVSVNILDGDQNWHICHLPVDKYIVWPKPHYELAYIVLYLASRFFAGV